ncbi:MAG TPA: B12-binding domain-containing radical SAM protein [Phycisphaerae bacterium]|nr:B12-binding domain-containing radical SAM protein [Phycisphaerae bacterium]
MNALLIYPECPDTFWSFKHALKFLRKRAGSPPVGLLTVAAMLPEQWSKRLVDLNVTTLRDDDLAWADYAFISAMTVQRDAARQIIARCREAGVRVVAGGPLFTIEHEQFQGVDHFVLNEAEVTLPPFLNDLARGQAKSVYTSTEFPDLHRTPVPLWQLADLRRYGWMSLQFSRGCPFNCDFCNVTSLFGHKPRTKTSAQIIAELDSLYALGWRRGVFFVDDNFIGNKRLLREDLLPALIRWRRTHPGIPLNTEVSMNLADDPELMAMMVEAGFDTVFVGLETPEEAGLAECSKKQNQGRHLVADIKRMQRAGLQVQGGFIVGFDSDGPSIFQRQIDFIQSSGIVTAMVGLLQAIPGTRLYDRLKSQGRILGLSSGDNVDGTTNIRSTMSAQQLREGYQSILKHIYAPRHYYQRVRTFLHEYRAPTVKVRIQFDDLMAFLRSVIRLGILGRGRWYYWRLLVWTRLHRPELFSLAVRLAIAGYHFQKVCRQHVLKPLPGGAV